MAAVRVLDATRVFFSIHVSSVPRDDNLQSTHYYGYIATINFFFRTRPTTCNVHYDDASNSSSYLCPHYNSLRHVQPPWGMPPPVHCKYTLLRLQPLDDRRRDAFTLDGPLLGHAPSGH